MFDYTGDDPVPVPKRTKTDDIDGSKARSQSKSSAKRQYLKPGDPNLKDPEGAVNESSYESEVSFHQYDGPPTEDKILEEFY